MRNQRISKFLSFFILLAFCITGIYQTYVLADSFFVCQSENSASIYETSSIDFTEDIFFEDSCSARLLTYSRKEQEQSLEYISNFSDYFNGPANAFPENSASCFADAVQENCINHFCCSVITNYIHQKDGQKIA